MDKQAVIKILTKHVDPLKWVDEIAEEIIALSPVVDGGLELTPGEIDDVFQEWSEKTQGDISKKLDNTFSQAVSKATIAKATPIIKAQAFQELFAYNCEECSTPGFVHLVIPIKEVSKYLPEGEE